MTNCFKSLALGAVFGLAALSVAQSGSQGVVLKSHIDLSTFGAGSGNDCWGYTSPSGREYALMGLNNQVAFIEVTDPTNPVIVEQIAHNSSTWGDIKVYGHFAYVVTERQGTGIQVIDMSDIDNGNVLLVKTLGDISRAHNVVVDTVNGYLYTVGTRGAGGTTKCFSLADPANPVLVGPASMSDNYLHDAQVVTYTTGPLAGKQYIYGFSEGRGVDIIDVTDKNNPFLVKRVTYPDMGYCHQGWVSSDLKYLYVDDEFDETNLDVVTRSLVFNIEDPANAFFMGTFSTNLNSIDHNQYIDDGFSFQANYRSGLQIFDQGMSPINPIQTGWYDTFPSSDGQGYDGAWSNYPYFKSGYVVVSDIDSGFYLFDVTEAVTRNSTPETMDVAVGTLVSGSLTELTESDANYVQLRFGNNPTVSRSPIVVDFTTHAFDNDPQMIRFVVDSKSAVGGYDQVIYLYDWVAGNYVQMDRALFETIEKSTTVTVDTDANKFVNPTTREVKARLEFAPRNAQVSRLDAFLNKVQFRITR